MKRNRIWLVTVAFCCVFGPLSGCEEAELTAANPTITKPATAESPARKTAETEGSAVIAFEKTVHDFGEIPPGSKHNCEFKFKNTGDVELKIGKVKSTCGCTVFDLAKRNYAPGQTGTLKVKFTPSKVHGKVTRHLFVPSNDTKNPEVELSIKANVTLKIDVKPEKLNLALNKENAGCSDIILTSNDGQAFSITEFSATDETIMADFDPNVSSRRFVMKPTVDKSKLAERLSGKIMIKTTHPGAEMIDIPYSAPSAFETKPRSIIVQNVDANEPIHKKLLVKSNYGDDFEIESVTSTKGTIKLLKQEKEPKGIALYLEILPPKNAKKIKFSTDELNIQIKGSQKLKVRANIWYSDSAKSKRKSRLLRTEK